MKRPTRFLWVFFGTALLAVPVLLLAQGLVPCGNDGQPGCQLCHGVVLVDNIISWLVGVLFVIAAIIFVVAGFQLVTSGGDVSRKEAAKKKFTNTIIGFVIVLSGWLIVDTGMKALLPAQSYGVWNQIQCVDQFIPIDQETPEFALDNARITASGANTVTFSGGDVTLNVAAIQNAGEARSMAEAAARAAGITDERLINTYVALVQQESSMCQNKVGPSTKYGTAYGCGQMLLSTAQGLDPNATADRLVNDDAYNLSLSAQYFQSRLDLYDGNTTLALASYNGGTKANSQSSVCPGQLAWQCELNTGYAETRNYVSNIERMAAGL